MTFFFSRSKKINDLIATIENLQCEADAIYDKIEGLKTEAEKYKDRLPGKEDYSLDHENADESTRTLENALKEWNILLDRLEETASCLRAVSIAI